MNRLFFLILSILLSSILFAQDSLKSPLANLKKGIYYSYSHFISNKPTSTSPLAIDTILDYNETDTFISGYDYHFLDSSDKPKDLFSLYDGKNLYLYFGSSLKFSLMTGLRKMSYPSHLFQKADGGRFPYILLGRPVFISINGLVDAAASINKQELWYFNKEGKFLKATAQAIGVFLRSEKDLLKEYEKEKRYNNEVYIKYLIQMNQRYPI